jgi:hypothetical protein
MTSNKMLDHGKLSTVTKKVAGTTKIPKLPVLHRLIRDMSSDAYHGTEGTWSSSQLKDVIEDEEVFIQKYIKKSIARQEREAFDTGTYFHTGCLEPHKISKEVAVFPGKTRYGKQWDAFRVANKGKLIISENQKKQGDGMIKAVQASPISMDYLKGVPEISLFIELFVYGGEIYAPHFKKVLRSTGWEVTDISPKVTSKGYRIVVKTRADTMGDTFISDLKSTSGRANNSISVRGSISKYKYDLSAAFYLDLFSLMNEDISAFIWIFASKENPCAASWIATKQQILVGRAKWSWAIKRIADLAASDWEIVDYLREAEPMPYELEWLKVKDTDLL